MSDTSLKNKIRGIGRTIRSELRSAVYVSGYLVTQLFIFTVFPVVAILITIGPILALVGWYLGWVSFKTAVILSIVSLFMKLPLPYQNHNC